MDWFPYGLSGRVNFLKAGIILKYIPVWKKGMVMYYAISLSEYLLIIHHLIKTNKQTQNWSGHVDHTFAAVDSSILSILPSWHWLYCLHLFQQQPFGGNGNK